MWASGNGGRNGDTCAMDGYVSSIYTIAVGSVDQRGVQAPFDEDCTGKLAVAVNHNSSGGNSHQVVSELVKKLTHSKLLSVSAFHRR